MTSGVQEGRNIVSANHGGATVKSQGSGGHGNQDHVQRGEGNGLRGRQTMRLVGELDGLVILTYAVLEQPVGEGEGITDCRAIGASCSQPEVW